MTIINALNVLKAAGIKTLVGLSNTTSIEEYIAHAEEIHNTSVKYAAQGIRCHQYTLDHEDDARLIELSDGHYIIAKMYGDVEMALYGTYETEDEMNAAFEAYQIAEKAEAIASEMELKRPGEASHAVWAAIATVELRAAYAAATDAFARDFGPEQAC